MYNVSIRRLHNHHGERTRGMESTTVRSQDGRKIRSDSAENIYGIENLRNLVTEYYQNQKMSSEETSKILREKHQIEVSDDIVLRLVEKFCIKRSHSEAISISKLTLCQDRVLTKELVQIIDGLNFGDASIRCNHNTRVARLSLGSVHQEFASYCQNLLLIYKMSDPHFYPGPKGKGMWETKTLFHRDLYEMYLRWYPNDIKVIPSDIEFTPEMVLLWYLGDGCLSSPLNGNARYMYFATNCFSRESLEKIVVPKFAEIGIEVCRITDDCRVFIQTNSIPRLLKYMGGRSPVSCFDYKFDIEEWRINTPMKQAALMLNIEYQRLSNWVKHGLIEHSRSPGGKKVVFTADQLKSLADRIESGELPREKGRKRPVSQKVESRA